MNHDKDLTELIGLLNDIKPNFGDVGTRDIDVRAQRDRIDRAIAALTANQAADAVPVATVIKTGADRQWMSENLGTLPDGTYSLYLHPSPTAAPASEPTNQMIHRLISEHFNYGTVYGEAAAQHYATASEIAEFAADLLNAHTGAQVAASKPAELPEEAAKAIRFREYVRDFAKRGGWNPEDGEGAFEFIQRFSYAVGIEDAGGKPPGTVTNGRWPIVLFEPAAASGDRGHAYGTGHEGMEIKTVAANGDASPAKEPMELADPVLDATDGPTRMLLLAEYWKRQYIKLRQFNRAALAERGTVGEPVRDWAEDFAQENGQYENKCSTCKSNFMGNKHRRICKACAQRVPQAPTDWAEALRISDTPAVDEALRNFVDDSTEDNAVCVVLAILATKETT